MLSIISYIFQPAIDALFGPNIAFDYRWRLLLLQPLTLITYSIIRIPYLFSAPFTTVYIPIRTGQKLRALVYLPRRRREGQLSPLHISFHSGGFIGGFPEVQSGFNKLLPELTGAVVIAPHYRVAPRHVFPAAIDDADDIVEFCLNHAEELWGADPKLLTVDGFSAGCNLALAICQQDRCHPPAETAVKASVTFYAPVDLRLKPVDKPRPDNFPKRDPMAVFLPLYDAYAGPVRAENMENPRLSPILSDVGRLPERMLLIVPAIDILVHEQLTFVERVQRELVENGLDKQGRSCEAHVVEGAFHGWLELPYLPRALKEKRDKSYQLGIDMLRATHQKYGWTWSV
ncbi:uncharacterized protein PV09_03446 [Verruconis gallopava]|uniref:Alpha/beta hydrolase fold-3 domain-containing protein n=1 Tax=Verruconis gallopava TaxID=253628 RepID=A0A0D1XS71_9PEZI|nr:uncharacterized protein PV09_03446 [Verruconis gallopava]KIW05571.1 hypothetical protein PV09_03446 [Verruconis gallopava]